MLKPAKGRPLSLWESCWSAIQSLRPAFSRQVSFMWFATVVAGLMVRPELRGVTSIIRALNLRPKLYDPLRKHFHSSAIKLDQLAALWTRTVQRLFSNPVRFNGRLVLVGDGIKIPKRGKQMPGVKLLHQRSNCSSSSQYESRFIDWRGDPGKPTWGGKRASEEKSCWPAWCDILNRRAERGFAARNESDSRKGCGFLHPSWIRCDDA